MPKSRLQLLLVLAWLPCQSVSAEEFIQPLLPMAEVDVLAAPTTHFPMPVQDMNCASIEMEQKSYAASGGSRLSMNELAQTYRDVSGKSLAPLDVAKYAAKMIPGALGSSRMSQCSDLTGDQAMAILALNEIKTPSLPPPPQLGNDKPPVIRTAGLLPAVLPAAGQLVGNVVGTSVNLVTSVTNILPVVTGSLLGN